MNSLTPGCACILTSSPGSPMFSECGKAGNGPGDEATYSIPLSFPSYFIFTGIRGMLINIIYHVCVDFYCS